MSDFGVSFGANWLSYSGGSRKERETVERRGRERQSKGEGERDSQKVRERDLSGSNRVGSRLYFPLMSD